MRSVTDLPRDVAAMAVVAFCVALGFGVVAPAIPLFASEFGVSATAAGAVVSAFAFMRFVSALAAGRLVDRFGQRTMLVVGLAVVAVSSLLAGFSGTYAQLLVLRGVGGVGSAIFAVAAVSLVLAVAAADMRGRAMGVYRSGFLLGGMVGPAVGGAVLGLSLRAPFFLYAGTLAVAGAAAIAFVRRPGSRVPEGDPQASSADSEENPERSFREVLALPEYQAALVANAAVGFASFGLRAALVPLFFVQGLGAAAGWVGVAFLVSTVVQTALMIPAGRWTDTAGRRPALLVGSFATALGLGVLALSGSVWMGLVGMAVFGAGSAYLGTAPGALVGDVAGRRSGTVVAVFNMASDLGAVVGPVLAGVLVDRGSFPGAFGAGVVFVVIAGLLGLRLREDTGPAAR